MGRFDAGLIGLIHVVRQSLADAEITGSRRITVNRCRLAGGEDIFNRFFNTGRCRNGRIADTEVKHFIFTDDFTLFLTISKEFADNRTLGA